jgi:hypothetical protein
MSTRTRTVAEIIGQTADGSWPHDGRGCPPDWDVFAWKCGACGEWINESRPRTQCPIDWRNATPTPDVMLAWLLANVGDDIDQLMINVGREGVLFRSIPAFHGDPRTNHRAPTLHEALTAAVLAVAEREEPGDE